MSPGRVVDVVCIAVGVCALTAALMVWTGHYWIAGLDVALGLIVLAATIATRGKGTSG